MKRKDRYQDYESYEDYVRRVHPEDADDLTDDFFEEEVIVIDDDDDIEEVVEYEDDPEEEIIEEIQYVHHKKRPKTRTKKRVVYVEDDDDDDDDVEIEYVKAKGKKGKKGRKGKKDMPKKKKGKGLLFFLLLLGALLIGAMVFLVASRYKNLHQMDNPNGFSRDLQTNMSQEAVTNSTMKDYTNIALFGVDSREEELLSGNNRSDMIIIMSINKKNGDVRLMSVLRDTYLDVGDGTHRKCNYAFNHGGVEQAINMLNQNLDLNISDFVTIGFGGLANLIDAVGGVEIDVTEDEIHGINDYQSTMAEELGRGYNTVSAPGVQTLDGLQAVAYCRIRYTAGDDYKRTERQREVLMQTFNKAKRLNPKKLNQITETVFNEVATSLTMPEAMLLMSKALTLDIVDTSGFPNAEMRTSGTVDGQSCVIPRSLASNVQWAHAFLFGEDSFQVSQKVSEISYTIDTKTAGIP